MSEPTKIDTGGPAFPCPATGQREGDTSLTIRDWFASQPMNEQEFSMLRDAYFSTPREADAVSVQTLRYFHADRMIAARKESP